MGKSGDPRKQQRPDQEQRDLNVAQLTQAAPPMLAGVVTQFGAVAVPFPLFGGGKAIELQAACGPFVARLRVDPDFAEAICAEIMEAAQAARSNITPAAMTDVAAVAEQARKVRA
jgi:hypothetical protein